MHLLGTKDLDIYMAKPPRNLDRQKTSILPAVDQTRALRGRKRIRREALVEALLELPAFRELEERPEESEVCKK